MMKITLQIHNDKRLDIGVNRNQFIKDTFKILNEKGICYIDEITYVKILRTGRQISILLTYEEAAIVAGDILYIKNQSHS